MERSSSNVNGSSGNHLQQTDDKIRSLMLDFDVLDCPVCRETLTVPIFQCENGHLACSSCCPKMSNKCPVCALPLGHNRCRAMESVVESAYVPCRNAKFGCTKKLSYRKGSTHEKECTFSQCSCLAQDCSYTCSYKDLFDHYTLTHLKGRKTYNLFSCGSSFTILFNIRLKIGVLKDTVTGQCFAVQCLRESYGVYVTVSCIAPPAPQVGMFSCRLSYTVDGHTMTYESPEVERTLELSFQTPQAKFLLIPNSLLRGDILELNLCIKKLNQG